VTTTRRTRTAAAAATIDALFVTEPTVSKALKEAQSADANQGNHQLEIP